MASLTVRRSKETFYHGHEAMVMSKKKGPLDIVVSAIAVWEIAQLEALRRLELSMDVRAWVPAIESTRLPGERHRDPADRILIATARLMGAS